MTDTVDVRGSYTGASLPSDVAAGIIGGRSCAGRGCAVHKCATE